MLSTPVHVVAPTPPPATAAPQQQQVARTPAAPLPASEPRSTSLMDEDDDDFFNMSRHQPGRARATSDGAAGSLVLDGPGGSMVIDDEDLDNEPLSPISPSRSPTRRPKKLRRTGIEPPQPPVPAATGTEHELLTSLQKYNSDVLVVEHDFVAIFSRQDRD